MFRLRILARVETADDDAFVLEEIRHINVGMPVHPYPVFSPVPDGGFKVPFKTIDIALPVIR